MGWSSAFVSALNNSAIVPYYELEFLTLPNGLGDGFTITSDTGAARISEDGPSMQGTSVIPGRWNVSFGGFTVDVVGDLRPYNEKIAKGQMAILRCAIRMSGGYSPAEIVGYGQLYSIRGGRQRWTLAFRDLLTTFQTSASSKISGSVHSTNASFPEYRLFTNAGRSTGLSAPWNGSSATISVNDGSFFERESTESGIIKITHSGGTFYLNMASVAGNNITITSSTAAYPSPDASSAVNVAGTQVFNTCRLKGKPYNIMAKILRSTGASNPVSAGPHGSRDTYPITWSVGGELEPQIFDISDALTMSEYLRTSTGVTYRWQIVLDEVPSDGIRNIITRAASAGQWPVWRQGAVSWRCAIHPNGFGAFQHPIIADSISDDDIIAIEDHEWFSPDAGVIYNGSKITFRKTWASGAEAITGTSGVSGNIRALPAGTNKGYDNSLLYRIDGNESLMAAADLGRIHPWNVYTHAKITLRTKLRLSTLCAGDIVKLTSAFIYDRDTPNGRTFNNRRAMVTSVNYSISRQSCIVSLAILPDRNL